MSVRIGRQTISLDRAVNITESFSCVGSKESRGPLRDKFDICLNDDKWGETSFEKCERKMFKCALHGCLHKAQIDYLEVDALLAGDLLNQTISASFSALDFDGSHIGMYGACSTMAESLAVGSCMIDGGSLNRAICMTGSHFCTAERQYRMPLDMGTQKTPSAQTTVTGVGAMLIGGNDNGAAISSVTFGKVVDLGISDANNMGAAMAPAAASTIAEHLKATGKSVDEYDLVITGDLGKLGTKLTNEILREQGINLGDRLVDCGCCIFSEDQDPHMGGSGCGCSAVVMSSHFIPMVKSGEIKRILFVATGALLSLTSSMQGDNIPSVAHAVEIFYTGDK